MKGEKRGTYGRPQQHESVMRSHGVTVTIHDKFGPIMAVVLFILIVLDTLVKTVTQS